MTIQASWHRIETWMAANAPETLQSLNPPASASEIAALDATLEAELGVRLPADFAASLAIHNGQQEGSFGFFDAARLNSVQEIRAGIAAWQETIKGLDPHMETEGDPEVKQTWCNQRWIAFADNQAGEHCLDLDPSPEGTPGQIIFAFFREAERLLEADSFAELLNGFAEELEAGEQVYSKDYGGIVPIDFESEDDDDDEEE